MAKKFSHHFDIYLIQKEEAKILFAQSKNLEEVAISHLNKRMALAAEAATHFQAAALLPVSSNHRTTLCSEAQRYEDAATIAYDFYLTQTENAAKILKAAKIIRKEAKQSYRKHLWEKITNLFSPKPTNIIA